MSFTKSPTIEEERSIVQPAPAQHAKAADAVTGK
jgi:hypothetical protein